MLGSDNFVGWIDLLSINGWPFRFFFTLSVFDDVCGMLTGFCSDGLFGPETGVSVGEPCRHAVFGNVVLTFIVLDSHPWLLPPLDQLFHFLC